MDPVFIIAAIILFVVFACLYGASKNKRSTDYVMPSACDTKDSALEKGESDIVRDLEVEKHKEYIQDRIDNISARLNETNISSFETKTAARSFVIELLGIFGEIQDYVAANKIEISGCDGIHEGLMTLFVKTTELYSRSSESHVLVAVIDTETTGLHSSDYDHAFYTYFRGCQYSKYECAQNWLEKRDISEKTIKGLRFWYDLQFPEYLNEKEFQNAVIKKFTDLPEEEREDVKEYMRLFYNIICDSCECNW